MNSNRKQGLAAVEFALVLPVLVLLMFGLIQFAWLMMSETMLMNASSAGARVLAAGRGSVVTVNPQGGPWTETLNQVTSSASALNPAKLTITTSIAGTTCTSDTACAASLASNLGGKATVAVSYTFTPLIPGYLTSIIPSTLTSTMVERVQ